MSSHPPSTHPYAPFIRDVQRPARYMGGEYQAVVKDPASVRLSVCLAFPDIYDVGMSHLGTRILYGLLNAHPGIACERAFHPWEDMERELRARALPVLSLETHRPLSDFDVLGFSLQYELTYANVLNLLDLSGLPVRTADRGDDSPLIIAGGPNATHPEPLAPFVDAFLVGEAEDVLVEDMLRVAGLREQGAGKAEVLRALAGTGHWYCPALYDVAEDPETGLLVVAADAARGPHPVGRAVAVDIDAHPFPSAFPVPAAEAIFDRAAIEIARGCTEGCRFCQAGMIYRPVRERDPEGIVDTVLRTLRDGGYDEASLTALSTADYTCIQPLLERLLDGLQEEGISNLGISSLRAYGLSERILDRLAALKSSSLTFAPEGGTQRMRDLVNKNVSEQDIADTAHRVFSRGWTKIKLYFMIGLPEETDEDVEGIIALAATVRDIGLTYHKRGRVHVTASVSTHVPKPHTPFQWAAQDTLKEIQRKQAMLTDLARRARVNLKLHNERISWLEGLLARGDRRVADLVEAAWKKGCRLDGWDDQLRFDHWEAAIAETGIDPARYHGVLPVGGRLPWDHLDLGVTPRFLEREWQRATRLLTSPPCGKPVGQLVHHAYAEEVSGDRRKLVCYQCGAGCDLTAMVEQRVDRLTRMGAVAPPTDLADGTDSPNAPSGDADAPAPPKPPRRERYPKPPTRPEQGEGFRYRLRYTKLGTIALTSQLDLARILPRVLRRARVPLKQTQGFAQKPLIAYGPALPLGIPSLCEVVDLTALEDVAPPDLMARLNAVADPGLHVLAADRLEPKAPACSKTAKLAAYVVAAAGLDADAIAALVAVVEGTDPLPVTLPRHKGDRRVDLRDSLLAVHAGTPLPEEARFLGIPEERPVLRYTLRLDAGPQPRPPEVLAGLGHTPTDPAALTAVRTGLFKADENPLI